MLLDPDLPFGGVLELPYRGNLLQFIDRPLACLERIGPMLGADDDQHDVLSDVDLSVSVKDEHLEDVEIFQRTFTNLANFF